jgi:O-antigen/teichoic acid export membrane protein
LTYAFLVLAARSLGADGYGQIGVLWGAMFLAAIIVFRPLEQLLSRSTSERLAQGMEARSVLRTAGIVWGVGVCLVLIFGAAAWRLLDHRLFSSDSLLTVLLIAGIVFYGCEYLVRGLLGGVRWFAGYGVGLLADAGTRLLVALPLAFVASESLAAFAVVVAGLGGALVPLVLGRRKLAPLRRTGAGTPFRLSSAAAFTAPAALVAAADQLLVNGGPVLVVLGGASTKTAGLVFAATMLVRAPVYVYQGLAAALLPNFTHIHATSDRAEVRRAVVSVGKVLCVVGLVIAVAGALLGPTAMRALYGSEYHATTAVLGLLAASVGFYLVGGTFSQALLATGRTWLAAAAWSVSAVLFVVSYALIPGDPLTRIAAGLLLGTVVLAVLLTAAALRR